MTNIQNSDTPTNYRYGSYVNYKAFKDFHILKNVCDLYFKSPHCLLMAFIVESFHKNDKMPMIEINKERFVLMNSNYILDNLIYLKVKPRMLKIYLNELKTSEMIKVHIEGENNRYINVDKSLIQLCYEIDYSIRSINFLQKNKPTLWKGFVNEWQPHFKSKKEWKDFIDDFNDQRDIEGYSYNTTNIYEHLLNAVKVKVYKRK